jgi:copper chaperone CopZ
MRDLHLLIGGMGCRSCVREVTARLRDVTGVERVIADASTNRVVLCGSMEADDVMRALSSSTFTARIVSEGPTAASGP